MSPTTILGKSITVLIVTVAEEKIVRMHLYENTWMVSGAFIAEEAHRPKCLDGSR